MHYKEHFYIQSNKKLNRTHWITIESYTQLNRTNGSFIIKQSNKF